MSITLTASLTIKNDDDFRRVLEFVKPDESDTEPQTDEEYQQGIDNLNNLHESERCAWMTKHCTRLYVDFYKRDKTLSWSGRNWQMGYADNIAQLVVAQFPDIEFRICIGSGPDNLEFGISEQGKIRWLEQSDEINEMIEWGIDVDPYEGPTPEDWEALRQHRRARVQEMIDVGVDISPDTWPPTKEQYDEEGRLKYGDKQCIKHRLWDDADEIFYDDEDVVSMIADEYADIGLSKEELLEAGNNGMAKAHEHYDEKENEFCFYAYADSWIREAIFQAIGAELAKPTIENYEELQRHTREIVQEMIDLGVNISPDTWPPTREQLDEDFRLRCIKYAEKIKAIIKDFPDLSF